MAVGRSFKEYVTNKYYNELFSAVSEYALENRDSLDLQTRRVSSIDEIELADIEVKSVSVDDRPGMRIAFDIVVEGELSVMERSRYNDDAEQCHQWFMLRCEGDLECGLDDFRIQGVSVYDRRNKLLQPMSDALVPYISADKYEETALDFVRRYYPEALEKPVAIEPQKLAERMGLTVVLRQITDDFSIFGQIFFCDTDTELYDADTAQYVKTHIPGRTVIVDPNAYFLRNLGSVNNTIVHECVHWDKHRKAFALERLYNEKAAQIKCRVVGGVKDPGVMSEADWMEKHANVLAPRIQMPLPMFKRKAEEYIRVFLKETGRTNAVDVMEETINALATFFCVSRQAAKIRMVDAGYDDAIGVFNYVDGRYVQPHSFKKGALKKNQTFSVGLQDALAESVFSPKLRSRLESGSYLYVDTHFCFNSPKYITMDETGASRLTEYARFHMDECCLVFDLKVKSAGKYEEQYFTECVLCRDAASSVVFIANFSEDNKDHAAQAETIKKYNQDLLAVIRTLPQSFSGALNALIGWSEMKEEDLAWASGLSEKTIQRLRNWEPENVTIETVMQLCIGMQLPPQLSTILIRCSGNSFMMTEQHIMYQFLLNSCYTYTLEECNTMLESQNLKPLGRKNRSA